MQIGKATHQTNRGRLLDMTKPNPRPTVGSAWLS